MSFGANPTTGTQGTLGANQFPLSSVAVPGHANGDLTALEGGPESTDSNSNKTAPASIYIKDGNDVTKGTQADAAWGGSGSGTEIAILKKLVALLSAALSVTGTVTANIGTAGTLALETGGNLAAAKTDLDTIAATIGGLSDAAYSGSGNGSTIALLKKLVAELAATLTVSGTVTANAGTGNFNSSSVGTDGSTIPTSSTLVGASDGTNLRQLLVESSSNPNLRTGIYQAGNEVTVTQFHSSDNQALGSGNGLLVGGVTQILNPSGLLDRQRGTGFDAIPAVGVSTGTQQLAGPALTTTFNGAVTGNASPQSVVVASSANLKVGDMVVTQDNVEYAEITAIADSTHCTAIFKNNHASGQSLTWYHYNQARDASIGDNVGLTGLSPSATYLYNNITALLELDRSANGEKDGASGQGTAVAAEYEWNAGGPLNNSNVISGLQFDRARNLQAKGLGAGSLSNNPLAAGSLTLTLNGAPTTLMAGQQIILDRAGSNPEANYVGTGYTPGSTTVPLQNATAFSHAQNSTIEWDQFAGLGPQLSGFTPAGVGIEEEAIYNPSDGKYYIERSATSDAMPGANIIAESPALWNGSTFDRLKGDNTGAARSSMYGKNSTAGDTPVLLGTGGQVQTQLVDATGTNVAQVDSSGRVKTIVSSALPAGSALIGTVRVVDTGGSNQLSIDSTGNASVKGGFTEQASLSAGSLNADLVASTDVSAYKSFSVQVTGSFSGTLTFQGSNDNSNWVALEVYNIQNTNSLTTTTGSTGLYGGPLNHRYLRIRMTSYTSGTANGTLELYTIPAQMMVMSISASQSGTWTVQPGNTPNTTPWLESIHDGTNKANVLAATSVSNALSAQGALITAGADQEVSYTTTTVQNVASTDVTNYRWVSVQINAQGTSSTVAFQGSNDNSNWFSILLFSSTAANNGPNSSVTTTGIWHGPLPCRYFRLNVSGISAGTTSGVVELQTMPSAIQSMAVTAVQGGTWTINAQTATTGGSSDYHLISAATTNANNIKNSAGQVYGYELGNNGTSDAWVKLYNSASVPTAGSGTPYRTIYVPKGARASYHSSTGLLMGTGIGLTITGGAADADTTAVGAAQVTVEIDYK